jgi:hypothetical protein
MPDKYSSSRAKSADSLISSFSRLSVEFIVPFLCSSSIEAHELLEFADSVTQFIVREISPAVPGPFISSRLAIMQVVTKPVQKLFRPQTAFPGNPA